MAKAQKQEKSMEAALWESANKLRGAVEPAEYKHVVLSLIFLKYASDKFEERRQEIIAEGHEAFVDNVAFYAMKSVFYLPPESRWSYIMEQSKQSDIALKIDTALYTIEKNNESLRGALPDNYYSRLGLDTAKLASLLDEINKIELTADKEQDVMGRVYEYFLSNFALQEGKGKGEFYTPKCIVNLIAELIEPYKGKIYDPCCGSGGMFVQSLKFVDRHDGNRLKVSIIGQESNPDTWRLCKMNLAIRGISHNLGDTNASTFTNDLHKDMTVDYIMANPPFNLKGWRAEDALTDDPRFMRAGYSVMPPVANANYAWILHMLSKLDVNHGVAGFLLANGALNIGDAEGTLRREILERDRVEAIIVLPRDMFYTTDISVTLWIVNMNKKAGTVNGRQLRDRTHEVLFMDLRRWDENIEEIVIDKGKKKKKTVLSDAQIAKIKEVYSNWQNADTSLYSDVPEFCRSVKLYDSDLTEEERQAKVPTIESKGYSLAPSKYIEFIDHDLEIDYEAEMARIQAEMRDIISAEKKSQTMLEAAFRGIGYGID